MTKNREEGENEITTQAKREAAHTGEDIQVILQRMLRLAKQQKDTVKRMKIIKAEKFLAQAQCEQAQETKMTWYAAHIILYFKLRNRKQRRFRVWENIVLIRAHDSEEAFAKAEERGREEAVDDESLTWGGYPARVIFAGVRKLTLCEDRAARPSDGTEITYIEMDLQSEAAIRKLVEAEPVAVEIVDSFPEDADIRPDENGTPRRSRQRTMK